jgi:hypothetical protein
METQPQKDACSIIFRRFYDGYPLFGAPIGSKAQSVLWQLQR